MGRSRVQTEHDFTQKSVDTPVPCNYTGFGLLTGKTDNDMTLMLVTVRLQTWRDLLGCAKLYFRG
jgi:hypothetical protein